MNYRVAVFLDGEIKNDYRVLKTIRTLSRKAYIDVFYSSLSPHEIPTIENCTFYPIQPKRNLRTKIIQNSLFGYEFIHFYKHALSRKKKYDFVWANDLPTLLPAAKLAKKTQARLIYDSHEIYLETLNQFFPWANKSWKTILYHIAHKIMQLHGAYLEKKYFKQVDQFVTVNQSLLTHFERKHGVNGGKIIMNFPYLKPLTPPFFDFRKAYNWHKDHIVLLYQGGLNGGRGMNMLVEAMAQLKERFRLVIIGEGMLKPQLVDKTKKMGLTEIIAFIDFLSLDILPYYTSGADIGINLLEPVNLSKLYASPNKLYEYIHANIPVLASSTPENKKVFDRFNIGYLCDNTVTSVVDTLMQINLKEFAALKSSLAEIATHFTWESQEASLISLLTQFDPPAIPFQECSICLLNTENCPEITFGEHSICETCQENLQVLNALKPLNESQLNALISRIKSTKKSHYDCLIGISGGSDSSYLVYLAKKWGLNPLLLHVDGGWNNEQSVRNIQQLIKHSGFDYKTIVIPWEEMQDLQRSFVLSEVMDIDLPFDNLMIYYNYKIANDHGIKCVFNGYNSATEGFLPKSFTHFKYDKKNIQNILDRFGRTSNRTLKFLGPFEYFYFEHIRKIHFVYPLNLIDYKQEDAKTVLKESFGWQDYDAKHQDNFFTKYYQDVILPQKFGIHKKLAHQSMLILSNQTTKEALKQLDLGSISNNAHQDEEYFLKKLDLDPVYFHEYLNTPGVNHRYYGSNLDLYESLAPIYRKIRKISGFQWFK